MEKNARWDDASLLPERGLTLTPAVDANLRDRIRSLLVSRNQQNPPRTPCPSPDHNFTPRNSEENRSDSLSIHPKAYKFSPAQAVTQHKQLEDRSSDMGATRFDGPAGHIDAKSADTHARRLSQPDGQTIRKTSGDWAWSSPTSGLNQRAHGDVLGCEASMAAPLHRTKSSASKKSTNSRIPRFHLRTVPPAKDVNKILRPNPLHVPGSYRSEVDTRKGHDPITVSPPLEDRSEAPDDGILAVSYHAGPTHEHSHQAAVAALKDVVKHDHHTVHQPASSPTHGPLCESTKAIVTAQEAHELPQGSFAGPVDPDQPAEPISSFTDDPEKYHGNSLAEPVFIIGDEPDGGPECSDDVTPLNDNNQSLEQVRLLNGPQISDLLAALPPVRQTTMEDLANDQEPTTTIADLQETRLNRHPSVVSSLHSVALDQTEDAARSVSPLLSKIVDISAPAEADENDDEARIPLIPDTRRSSQAAARFPSVSRAMSMLSEMSIRSGLKTPSLASSKYKRLGSSPNLTTRPRSRSKRSASETVLANEDRKTPIADGQQTQQRTPDSKADSLTSQPQQNSGQGFTKAITDMESVLQEALSIAGQTANSDSTKIRPDFSQARRKGYSRADSVSSNSSSDYLSSLTGGVDEEANYTTLPQPRFSHRHENASIKAPEGEWLYNDRHKRIHDGSPHPGTIPKADDVEPPTKRLGTQRELLQIPRNSPQSLSSDRAPLQRPSSSPRPSKLRLELKSPPPAPQIPPTVQAPAREQHTFLVRDHGDSEDTMTRIQIRDYVNSHQRPPIQPRLSSRRLKRRTVPGRIPNREELNLPDEKSDDEVENDCECVPYVADFETSGLQYHPVFRAAMGSEASAPPRQGAHPFRPPQDRLTNLRDEGPQKQETSRYDEAPPATNTYSLEGRHHFSIREPRGFSLSRSHRRSPIARDWTTSRKRRTATVACVTTGFVGLIIGIYAGEVPAIQYAIADEHHYTILGNVLFFIGLAITTALFYPLPLLHGRKPYTLAALAILLPLQFPQALAIDRSRSPYVATYRVGLLLPRVFAGIAMGFANINFITTLLDLYGASLQSGNPHQETVNENDVRRHGGGMGVWLSIWTWCAIGSIGLGFFIGACIISGLDVSWGFWILIILNAAVLLLNILTPEVRRSAYRRSMAEVRSGGDVSRRVARGEIKMHLESTGPVWFWEELIAGHVLAFRMLVQPGFALLALYQGWIYGQVVLTISVST